MTGRSLRINRTDVSRIEAHARSGLPRESCGIMLGVRTDDGWQVSGIKQSNNVAPPGLCDRFEIDPALLLSTQKAARAGGPRMIGVYHSHPTGKAEPSQIDLEAAWQTGMIWVISAVDIERIETRAYLREEAGFVPVPLQVMETE